MKIAVWNVERFKHKSRLSDILYAIESLKADIAVLTETDKNICPSYKYRFSTSDMYSIEPKLYKRTENRVSVFTNYKCISQYNTYDKYTALCIELQTEIGILTVYASIIGILGNRHTSYNDDLTKQMSDIARFAANSKNICICGDFNQSFCDNYYFTNFGRNTILQTFNKYNIAIPTKNISECIDHIAISQNIINNKNIATEEWNYDKLLSDHKGTAITIGD